jgi:hypothetical protein
MKKLIILALALTACTSADEAEVGTRKLLKQLNIEPVTMACMGSVDAAGSNKATCNFTTPDGNLLTSHCDFVWPSAGCTILRPGAGQ